MNKLSLPSYVSNGMDLHEDFFLALLLATKRRNYPYMALGDKRIMKPKVLQQTRLFIDDVYTGLAGRLFLGDHNRHLDDYNCLRCFGAEDHKAMFKDLTESSYKGLGDLGKSHPDCITGIGVNCLTRFFKDCHKIYDLNSNNYLPAKLFACILVLLARSSSMKYKENNDPPYFNATSSHQRRRPHLIPPDNLKYLELLEQEAELSYRKAEQQGNNVDARDLKKVFEDIKESRLFTLDWVRLAWGDHRLGDPTDYRPVLRMFDYKHSSQEYRSRVGYSKDEFRKECFRLTKERKLWLTEDEVMEINKTLVAAANGTAKWHSQIKDGTGISLAAQI